MIKATRHVDISIFTQLESLNVCFRGYTMLEKISFSSSIKKLTLWQVHTALEGDIGGGWEIGKP